MSEMTESLTWRAKMLRGYGGYEVVNEFSEFGGASRIAMLPTLSGLR